MRKAMSQAGKVELQEVEIPRPGEQFVLIKSEASAISTGTELAVLSKKMTVPLGNSGIGIVQEVGSAVTHLKQGDRVAVYGVATHAEYYLAPKHLTALVPAHVNGEEAAFTGLGAIAIQALRQADIHFGEIVVIVGLGILGQIIAQIADAAACHVIAMDVLEERCSLLKKTVPSAQVCSSNEELADKIKEITGGIGADTVLICAGSKDSELIDQAIGHLRDRGKIVIVGVPKGEFTRDALFVKEAQILISRAGGPGRYDERYEIEGIDYPIGYVRWTEGRNTNEFIRLLADGRLRIAPLISHRFDFSQTPQVYQLCQDSPRECMGIVLTHQS